MRDTTREWLQVFAGTNFAVSVMLAIGIGVFADSLATGLIVGATLFGLFIIGRALFADDGAHALRGRTT